MIQELINILVMLWFLLFLGHPEVVAGNYVHILLILAIILQLFGMVQGYRTGL